MTRTPFFGVGFYIAETNSGRFPYGGTPAAGALPTISGNVQDAVHGYKSGAISPAGTSSFPGGGVGNLAIILAVGTQDWGGSVGDSEYFYFGHGTGLKFKMSSASGWKINATDNSGTSIATGSTEYAWASSANVPNISVLRESARLRVWVNGVKEIDVSGVDSAGWNGNTITRLGGGSDHATKHWYIGQIYRDSTDVADDYADPTGFVSAFKVGNGTGEYSQFTASAGNTYDCVKDWSTGACNGDTDYVLDVGTAATTYRIYLATADFTLANATVAVSYSCARGNVAAKNTTGFGGLGDGTNIVEVQTSTYPDATTYKTGVAAHPLAPGGGAWSAFTMNSLEVGFRHDVGALADVGVLSALAAEIFGCTFLSDAPTGQRRRGGFV